MRDLQRAWASAPPHHIANTYGWDTVSAVRVGYMNRAIAATDATPEGFDNTLDGQDAGARSSFGAWRIGSGGDGRVIHMEMPLESVEAWFNTERWDGHLVATVEVQLHFLPHETLTSRPDGATPMRLMVRSLPSNSESPIATVLDLRATDGSRPNLSLYIEAVVKMALQEWLQENLASFGHVFATVNIFSTLDGKGFEWLKPSYVSYCFLGDERSPDDSVFAVLCRTGNRSPDKLVEQISPYAIPASAQAAFLISPERMLQDMVKPTLPQAFEGLKPEQIIFDEDNLQLSAKTSTPIKEIDHDGKKYSANLEDLRISLKDREMIMDTTSSVEVTPGIYSVCRSVGYYNIGMIVKSNGSKTLGYRESRKPEFQNWTRKKEGIVILEWVLSAISVIAGILAFVPGVNAAAIPVLIIAALVTGGLLLTLKLVETIHEDDAPPLDLLVSNATSAIQWANGERFELASAELNGSMQLAGDFGGPATKL